MRYKEKMTIFALAYQNAQGIIMKEQKEKFNIVADYYKQHYEEILGFVSKHLQYADDAEDVVQNVFVRLLRTEKMITPVTMPSLVYTIARNLIYDYWRHRRSVEEYEHFIAYSGRNEDLDVASIYSAVEIKELLERGIARLSNPQRVVFRMNMFDGMQVSEISKTLSLNYKSVENRLGSARKEIRRYMAHMLAS